MRIVPAIDVLHGNVVRGVGGRRDEYRPMVSRLTSSHAPLEVARALRDHFGLATLYVADLDAILGASPAWGVYAQLCHDGFSLWVDAGLREAAVARAMIEAGVDTVVAGLETMPGPALVDDLLGFLPPSRLLASLDMKAGVPLTAYAPWQDLAPQEIAALWVERGLSRLLLLDLARVGVGQGPGTEDLAAGLLARFAGAVEVNLGGGVRDQADLVRLKNLGAAAVLVASALHDGRIPPQST